MELPEILQCRENPTVVLLIFRRAPSIDYQEGIANEIISSNQRAAVIGRRLEASSSSHQLPKQWLQSSSLLIMRNPLFVNVSEVPFSARTIRLVNNNCLDLENNSVGVKKTIKVLRSQFDSEELFVFYVYHKVLDLKMSNSELFCISEDDKNLEDNFKNKVWRPLMTELFKDTGTSFTAIKAKNDRIKPILESKEGSNVIFKILDEFRPNTQFFSLQLAGLKGNMLSTTLNDDGLYTTSNIGGTFPGPPPRMSLGIAALQSDSFDIMDAHPVKPLDCPGCLLASRLYETFKE
ncbi:hypothetical protein HPULCUR_006383 [Helicostylum pulchrum]|uniref:Uncharacterized protein n=1 Tax=Helicostylum pulchrum TaxID=562976 RepID=A0ABP9Y2C3_9FUNG